MALPQQVRIHHGRFEAKVKKLEKVDRAAALVGCDPADLLARLLNVAPAPAGK